MTAEQQDFEIYEGEDKTIEISVTDVENGGPINLGSPTNIIWTVKESPHATQSSLIEKTYNDEEVVLENHNGTNDLIKIDLLSADSIGLGGRRYHHECRVIDGALDNHVVFSGTMTVKNSGTV